MPQMSPLKWLSLFIMFSFAFIFFNVLNYFCYSPNFKNNQTSMSYKTQSLNWKW